MEGAIYYLHKTRDEFESWHEEVNTQDDSPFDYWVEWCVVEGNDYAEVKEEEEACKAEENDGLVEISCMRDWHRRSMLEREYALLMELMRATGNMDVYDRFERHL